MNFHTIAQKAIEQYDLPIKSLRFLKEENNRFYLAQTKTKKYVLKIYEDLHSTINNTFSEHYMIKTILEKTDLKTPRIVLNKQGETITRVACKTKRGYKRTALFEYLDGESIQDKKDADTFHTIGQLMAKMHIATKGLVFPEHVNPKRWDKVFYRESEVPVYHLSKYEKYVSKEMVEILDELIRRIDIVFKNLYDERAPRLIHGDLNPWHIKSFQDQYILYDFEEALLGYPVMDIAVFLYYYRAREDVDFYQVKTSFMAGYRSVNQIPFIDEKLFEMVLIAKRIQLFNHVLTVQKDPSEYIKLSFPKIQEYYVSYK